MEGQGLVVLPSKDLHEDMKFFTNIGFRKEQIYPADNPVFCVLSAYGLRLQIDKEADIAPPTIHIVAEDPEKLSEKLSSGNAAPNGTIVKILPKSTRLNIPQPIQKFEITHLDKGDSWIVGRAGMLYRDMVPSRLGGTLIASHIRLLNDGPVPDMVHYHTVMFQLIYCYKGWVKVLYEDQGKPITLYPGDCVIQPPEIRHQVLESGDGFQVIEVVVPAQHVTTFDHHIQLPTVEYRPEREFCGQVFWHHQAKDAVWEFKKGFNVCDTGIDKATKGAASVVIAQPAGSSEVHSTHDCDVHFTFVLKGKTELKVKDTSSILSEGDAFAIPANMAFVFCNYSDNLEVLQVSIPKVLSSS
jgi:quercetin dioxygenase-like cupin family protein